MRQIGTLSRSIHYISDVKYKEIKLQKGQFIYLTRICDNPGISFSSLSNILKVDKTTTTKAIQKLIEAGYIYKKQNSKDKRLYSLMPTDKALEIYDLIIAEENRNIEVCFRGFTEEEKIIVNKLLERMAINTEEDWLNIKKGGRIYASKSRKK